MQKLINKLVFLLLFISSGNISFGIVPPATQSLAPLYPIAAGPNTHLCSPFGLVLPFSLLCYTPLGIPSKNSQLSKNNPDLLITLVCKVTVVQLGLVDLILFVLLFCAQLAHCTLEFGARQHLIGSNSQETTKQSFHFADFADPSTVVSCFPRPSHFVRGAHNTVQIKVYCAVCSVRQEHLLEVSDPHSRIRSKPELLGSCHGCTHQGQSGRQFFTESHRCIITLFP